MTERCRLYLITPPKLEPKSFADTLKRALARATSRRAVALKDVPTTKCAAQRKS
jgi:hypothetical protein